MHFGPLIGLSGLSIGEEGCICLLRARSSSQPLLQATFTYASYTGIVWQVCGRAGVQARGCTSVWACMYPQAISREMPTPIFFVLPFVLYLFK